MTRLPKYLPVLQRADRYFYDDRAIGKTMMLAGQRADGMRYLERAARACNGLEAVVEHTRALIDFADLLIDSEDKSRACALYEQVAKRWPKESGSVSAAHARRMLAGRCAR